MNQIVAQQLIQQPSMVPSLPHSIWDVPWVPPPLPSGLSYQMEGFTPAVFVIVMATITFSSATFITVRIVIVNNQGRIVESP